MHVAIMAGGVLNSNRVELAEDDEERRSEGLGFDPPVYKQRYNAVIALARQLLPKTV